MSAKLQENDTMRLGRMMLAAFVAVMGLALAGPVAAQAPKEAEPQFKQIKLTDSHIKGFIGAQADLAAMAQKQGEQQSDKPDPKIVAELDAIAKKHGFKDFADYDDIGYNITIVYHGIDPKSGEFTDQITSIKKEMEDIKADATIPEKDKKQMLDELAEALKHTPPVQYPENIELVKKHRAAIEKVLQ